MADWTNFVSPAITVGGLIVAYAKLQGDLTGRILGQETTLVRHERKLNEHDTMFEEFTARFNTVEVKAAKAEGFSEGFKAAQNKDH